MIDIKGKYLIANLRYGEVFNMPISAIEGKHYSEVLPESILKTHRFLINQGLKGIGQEFDEESDLGNGETINSIGKYIPVFDENNKQIALAVYAVDVTQLKHTEAELIALNNTKNRLLSVISHDIKAPLNSLKGIINISENITQDNLITFVDKVNQRLNAVTFNLDNLLNWAKGQMEGISLKPEIVDLNSLLSQNIELLSDYSVRKKVHINQNFERNLKVFVDAESLNLVIRNILNNAIKFSPEHSEVEVNASSLEESVKIEITDKGIGISQEYIDQLEKGSTALVSHDGTLGEKGTGLGLSLSLDLVLKNNGTLTLSRIKPVGTKVDIKIPSA
jgi:signal transduction histidine kinase